MSDVTQTAAQKHLRLIRILRLLAAMLILASIAASITAYVMSRQMDAWSLFERALARPLMVIANAVVGALILARYPRHIIGWLLLAMSVFFLSSFFVEIPYVLLETGRIDASDPRFRVALWVSLWNWIPQLVLPVILLPLYFPTGQLLSRRWRLVSAAGVVGMIGFMAASAIVPEAEGYSYPNPLVVPGGERIASVLNFVSSPLLVVGFMGVLASMAIRYRRAGVMERQQMKWLFYPVGMAIIWWLPIGTVWSWIAPQQFEQFDNEVGFIPFFLVVLAIPIAIGVAILRYHLYDIDVIIRRTLVYGIVTAALAAVYFGSVVLLQQLFAGVSGEQSPAAIVMSTLLIAALFSPLRRRAQELVDRRFFRAKYNAAQTLEGFARAARDETDLSNLTADLLSVVQTAMQPEHVGIWLRQESSGGLAVPGSRGTMHLASTDVRAERTRSD